VAPCGCERLCGRRRKLEEIDIFFYHVADYVRVSVDMRYSFIIITLCGQAVSVSDVTNFRLEFVIIPKRVSVQK